MVFGLISKCLYFQEVTNEVFREEVPFLQLMHMCAHTHITIAHEPLNIIDPHQAILFPDFYIYHTLGSNPLYILFYVYKMLKVALFFGKMLNCL